MTPHSLRFRLLVAAGISVIAALLITGMSLVVMFEHHVERRIGLELETYLNQITGNVELAGNGRISFNQPLADPRFKQPLSGLYWQIRDEVRPTLLRSRSLWDSAIALPADELTLGDIHAHVLPGPAGQTLLLRERRITFQVATQQRRLRIAVAVDRQGLVEARNAFAADMLPYLAVLAAVLLAAAWVQVRTGLAPMDALRRDVTDVRVGLSPRLEGSHPDEVMPLVDEVNALLDTQQQSIERARAWTADLAHGLKTPLTVLTSEAQRLREAGDNDVAVSLERLAENMRRRVDRELIRARFLSATQTPVGFADCSKIIHGVVRTLQRMPGGDHMLWDIQIPEGVRVSMAAEDATELLGNLLENATKWALKTVRVGVVPGDLLHITIEDDGPGVPAGQLDRLGQRGLRLDEKIQGSGLGLAIAMDIAEAYAGQISFGQSSLGGLAVDVRLPSFGLAGA